MAGHFLSSILHSLMLMALVSSAVSQSQTVTLPAYYFSPPYTSVACGTQVLNAATDEMLVGVPESLWDSGNVCGKKVTLSCVSESGCTTGSGEDGPLVTATIADHTDADNLILSEAAFSKLAPLEIGLITVELTMSSGSTTPPVSRSPPLSPSPPAPTHMPPATPGPMKSPFSPSSPAPMPPATPGPMKSPF